VFTPERVYREADERTTSQPPSRHRKTNGSTSTRPRLRLALDLQLLQAGLGSWVPEVSLAGLGLPQTRLTSWPKHRSLLEEHTSWAVSGGHVKRDTVVDYQLKFDRTHLVGVHQ